MKYTFIALVLACSVHQASAYKFYVHNSTEDNLDVKLIFTSLFFNTQRKTWAINAGQESNAIIVGGYRCLSRVQVKQRDASESAYKDIPAEVPADHKSKGFKICDDGAVFIVGEEGNYRWKAHLQ
ncbi:MAG: hypothetical protein WCE21_04210 [Candidatus Babeliales bacterium]